MRTVLLVISVVFLAAYGGYWCGKSRIRTQVIEKEVEVIKYVAQKRAKIQAEPNATRTELIELMRKGEL